MKRFIIQADDDLLRRVKKRAAERGVSVARVVRDALEVALGDGRRPEPTFIGKYASGGRAPARDTSDGFVAEPWRSS